MALWPWRQRQPVWIVGNDHLYGEGGNDFLDGGAGYNILVGGDGKDQFHLAPSYFFADTAVFCSDITGGGDQDADVIALTGNGTVVIYDFELGWDRLGLVNMTEGYMPAMSWDESSGSTVFTLPSGLAVSVVGVLPSSLTSSNFEYISLPSGG